MSENRSLVRFDYSIQKREEELRDKVRQHILNSKSDNTIRSYESDIADFERWCSVNGYTAFPSSEETICFYITFLDEQHYKVATIQRRLSAIAVSHKMKKLYSPTESMEVKLAWSGIRKKNKVKPIKKKAIFQNDLRRMIHTLPLTLSGIRDRAILLVGYAGAFRRSELVALDVEDVEFGSDGLTIDIRKSKTDQEGEGEQIGIPYGTVPETCPVRALQIWLEVTQIKTGSLFRKVNRWGNLEGERLSDRSVALVVKKCAEAANLDPSLYSGHSLRSGFASTAAMNGATEESIARQTRHRSLKVLRGYIQHGTLFTNNAASKLGL